MVSSTLPLFILLTFFFPGFDCKRYLGCYKDPTFESRLLSGSQTKYENTLTLEVCISDCKEKGFRYVGVEWSIECFCSNERPSFKSLADDSECDHKCSGDKEQFCGGGLRISVYDILDEAGKNWVSKNYLGCFEDGGGTTRLLTGTKVDSHLTTPEFCVGYCYRRGYRLAGTQYGKECFCGESLQGRTAVSETECQTECEGDKNMKCGGNWRLSVYYTGISDLPSDESDFLGCFYDNHTDIRLLSGIRHELRETNSPKKCVNLCISDGYSYSGTQFSYECFCGQKRPDAKFEIPEQSCRTQCPGDKTKFCGGNWSLFVYKTGLGKRKPVIPELSPSTPTVPSTDVPSRIPISVPSSTCITSETTVFGANACKGQVIFKEEFNGNAISLNKWTHAVFMPWVPDYEFVVFGGKSQNAYVKDGKLFIKPSLLEDDLVTGRLILRNCTGVESSDECERQAVSFNIIPPVESARMHSKNSFSFRYGIVEIVAKLPRGDWIVPELWLQPTEFAYGQGFSSGRVNLAMARGNIDLYSQGTDIGSRRLESGITMGIGENIKVKSFSWMKQEGWHSQFHKFKLNWSPNGLTFSVDNANSQELKPPPGFDMSDDLQFNEDEKRIWASGRNIAPFDKEFHLSLGLSVGGTRMFPDGSQSGNYAKPWRNWAVKGLYQFWEQRSKWFSTWKGEDSALQVDSITVTAL